jgi:general secretion pathway protein C
MIGKDIAAGVTVKEIHPRYVMLSEGGIMKRIELATDAKAGPSLSMGAPAVPTQAGNEMTGGGRPTMPVEPPPPPPPQQPMPPPTRVNPQPPTE